MGRRIGETLKKEEMSQAKLNKHEPEAISKGQGRSSLIFCFPQVLSVINILVNCILDKDKRKLP